MGNGGSGGDRSNNDQDSNYYDNNDDNGYNGSNGDTSYYEPPQPVVLIEDTYEVKIAKIKEKILNNQALTSQESLLYKGFMDQEDTTIANYNSTIAQNTKTIKERDDTITKRDAQLIQEWKAEETSKLNTIIDYNQKIIDRLINEFMLLYDDLIILINTNQKITDELNNLDITILQRIKVDYNYENIRKEAIDLLTKISRKPPYTNHDLPIAQDLIVTLSEFRVRTLEETVNKFMTDKNWFMEWTKQALSNNDDMIKKYKVDIEKVNKTNVNNYYELLTSKQYYIIENVQRTKSVYLLARESQVKANELLNKLKFDVKDATQIQTYRYVYDSVSAENRNIDKAIWNNSPGTVLKDKKAFNQLTENERLDGINSRLFTAYWFLFFVFLCVDIFLHNATTNNTNDTNNWWYMIPKYIILLLFPFIIGPFEGLLWAIGKRINDVAFFNV